MTSPLEQPPAGPPPEPPAVWWSSWPLRDRPWAAAGVVGCLAAAMGIVWRVTGKAELALLVLPVLVIPWWRFFLPASYEMGPDGVSRWALGRRTFVPWGAIGRHEVHATGVLLLPDRDRSALDPLRGMFVPWTGRREEVLAQVEFHLATEEG